MSENIFYTQDFLEYIALSISTMPSTLSKGNISECTITDYVVLGPQGAKTGKKAKVKSKADGKTTEIKAKKDKKDNISNPLWECGSDASMVTTSDFFYDGLPSSGLMKRVFKIGFNSNTDYWAIPFNTASELCPSTISEDWGGSSPGIYWEKSDEKSFWNCTTGSPTIIPGSSVELYFNESAPEFQCTIPSMVIGYGTSQEIINGLESEYKAPFGGYILVSPSQQLEDETKLIIYGVKLNQTMSLEPIEEAVVGSSTSLLDTVLSMDIVIL